MTRRLRGSLATKLLVSELLVIVAGAGTLLVVALSLGPSIFANHVRDALGTVPSDVAHHLDEAFGEATLVSLGIATAAATVTALAVSWFVSRRVVAPIQRLAASAGRIARGAYTERVPDTGTDELARLGSAFNEMAASLESAERRRRELLSDVAHELRTPLATVEAHVEALADGVLEADAETWSTMRGEVRRLGRLVEDLQRVSRAEERQLPLELAPVSPAALVDAAVRAAAPGFSAKGVALTTEIARGLPAVNADRDRLGEVHANLLDNALRHTPPGGRVTVAAAARGAAVEISVDDTGEGIAAEHLERVFERFFRADPARTRADGGSGIGLAVARALVEAHGGRLTAWSAGRGAGARFTVRLPAADAGPLRSAADDA